jgi:choline-sulfatase
MPVLTRRQALQSLATAALPGGRRNLVFIVADQHSGLALGAAGHPIVRTPRLDALARQGVHFTHAYCTGTTCAPSRASIQTGLHVHSHGVRENGVPLPEDRPALLDILDQTGYKLNDVPRNNLYRLEPFYKHLAERGYTDVASPIIGSRSKAGLIPTPYRYAVGRAGLDLEDSQDAFTIRNAIRFLDENKEQRFCLWVHLFGSHDPWVVPAPYDTMYRPVDLPVPPYRDGEYASKPAQQRRTWENTGASKLSDDHIRLILAHYFGMVSFTDMLVGRLLDKLSALRLDSNTAVVYMADHGDTMGHHRIFTKGFALYEPAMRIPLIMRSPGMPAGKRVETGVSGVDLLPTTLELLDLPPRTGIQGRSLLPLWRGRKQSDPGLVFASQGFEGYDRLSMWRTPDWKLTRYDEGGGELYDMRTDPHELNNLFDDARYASVRQRLSRQMEDWDRRSFHAPPRFPPGMKTDERERIQQAFASWMRKKG